MATVQKFLFDTSFDEPGTGSLRHAAATSASDLSADSVNVKGDEDDDDLPYAGLDRRHRGEASPPPEPAPEMYTESQLDAAREDGYLRGHAAALEDETMGAQRATAKTVSSLAAALETLTEQQEAFNTGLEQNATRLALAIVRRLFPTMMEANGIPEVEHLLAATLPDVLEQPRLLIRVNGAVAETIRQVIRPIQEKHAFDGKVTVRPDNDLPVGDCRLEWGDGGIERDSQRMWAEIEAVIARHLDEPIPPPLAPDPIEPSAGAPFEAAPDLQQTSPLGQDVGDHHG